MTRARGVARESGDAPNDWGLEFRGDAVPGLPRGAVRCFEERTAVPHSLEATADAMMSPGSPAAEEFRVLRTRVRAIGEERPFACVGLVSAATGEGKTIVSLGLAAAMAQEQGRRVLLVEADARRPAIERYLGLAREEGLVDWLESDDGVVPIRHVRPYGFWLFSAGVSVLGRPELLGSERMAGLIEAARQYFNFVLLDCPPLAAVADSVIMQDLVDGYLLVVRARCSSAETIARALSRLKPDTVRGVVFNDHHEIFSPYYKDAYERYSKKA